MPRTFLALNSIVFNWFSTLLLVPFLKLLDSLIFRTFSNHYTGCELISASTTQFVHPLTKHSTLTNLIIVLQSYLLIYYQANTIITRDRDAVSVSVTKLSFKRLGLIENVGDLAVSSQTWNQMSQSRTSMSRLQVVQQIFFILFSLTHNCVHVYEIYSIYLTFPLVYDHNELKLFWRFINEVRLPSSTYMKLWSFMYLLLDQNGLQPQSTESQLDNERRKRLSNSCQIWLYKLQDQSVQ